MRKLEELNDLKEYVKTKKFDELNSEDILKIMYYPHIISEICEVFNISESKFNQIRKKLNINNIFVSNTYRDIICLLYYANYKYPNLQKEKLNNFLNEYLSDRFISVANKQAYIKKLNSIDWFNLDLKRIIKENNIDLNYRFDNLKYEISAIKYLADREKEERLNDFINANKNFNNTRVYNNLKNLKENGKPFTKNDLTYDILYQLSIVENIPDGLIGNIFDLTKEQVRNERIKNDLQNVFAKKMINHPEFSRYYYKQKGFDYSIFSDKELVELVYNNYLKPTAPLKKWRLDVIDHYFEEKMKEYDSLEKICESVTAIDPENNEYTVNNKTLNHIGHNNKDKTKTCKNGKRINQKKSSENKIDAGTLGEEIIYKDEIKKLKSLGLKHLIDSVKWITQTEDKNVTLDGLGYDIISFNEKEEKIYIEVKCSTTNNSDELITFNLSDKEVKFMNGELDGIDKNHCFIYYVYNINKQNKTANKYIIDHNEFSNFNLISTNYKVEERYEKTP